MPGGQALSTGMHLRILVNWAPIFPRLCSGFFIKLPVSLDSVLIIDLTSHNFVLIAKTLKIAILRDIGKREGVKPRANARNIGCYMLLHVFGSCCAEFETGQTFEPTIPNISFVP